MVLVDTLSKTPSPGTAVMFLTRLTAMAPDERGCFAAPCRISVRPMPIISAGRRLGPYEILARIGAGGMGEVYKARDTRLDRTVAIKVSDERFSGRFEREAHAVAALNHPNICQLYDVGPNYLVMEFIDGSPLSPTDSSRRLLDLAVQIAHGLAAAHAAGIVHRDLKPGNILLTSDGRVKILDFGLAKAVIASSETVTMTQPGTVVGTVAYMSPEQARGDSTLGPQSDQFSFGIVLFELITHKRPFQRETAAETMAAIIREEPPALPQNAPVPLRWIIERLLAKDPGERYDSTGDLYRELRQVRERLSEARPHRQRCTGSETTAQSKSALVGGSRRSRLSSGGSVARATHRSTQGYAVCV